MQGHLRTAVGWVAIATGLLLTLQSCQSGGDGASGLGGAHAGEGGAAGSAGAAGGIPGGGASGASSIAGNGGGGAISGGGAGGNQTASADDACRAHVATQCDRRATCLGEPLSQCMIDADLCPDYYVNADSNLTVAELQACMPVLAARSCTDIVLDVYRSCFVAGVRPMGAGCVFPSQCASGHCPNGYVQCGTCGAGGDLGAACTYGTCKPGLYCDNGVCADPAGITYGPAGAACDLSATPASGCTGDLLCLPTASGNTAGVCGPPPGVGEPCVTVGTFSMICARGLACSAQTNGTCQDPNGACGAGPACDATSYCLTTSGGSSCQPRAQEGELCGGTTAGNPPCVDPAICPLLVGLCEIPHTAGESCDDHTPCTGRLACTGGVCQALHASSCPADPGAAGAGANSN